MHNYRLSEKFTFTKLDYMHRNPVNGKWDLSEDFLAYPYSSARFYELHEADGQIKLSHFKEFTS